MTTNPDPLSDMEDMIKRVKDDWDNATEIILEDWVRSYYSRNEVGCFGI